MDTEQENQNAGAPRDRDVQPQSAQPGERTFTPSTAENASFETGTGAAGFDAPAIGSINLDNPEIDLGDDASEAELDSRSSDEELEGYDENSEE